VTAAAWVIAGLVAAIAIYMRGWTRGRRHGIAEVGAWEALADQLDDGLLDAEATIERLNGNVEVLSRNVVEAYKNGQVDGQMFQAERDQWGLS
jgi:hypothetical protein